MTFLIRFLSPPFLFLFLLIVQPNTALQATEHLALAG